MKVKELVELLNNYDENLSVVIDTQEIYFHDIDYAKIRTLYVSDNETDNEIKEFVLTLVVEKDSEDYL